MSKSKFGMNSTYHDLISTELISRADPMHFEFNLIRSDPTPTHLCKELPGTREHLQ